MPACFGARGQVRRRRLELLHHVVRPAQLRPQTCIRPSTSPCGRQLDGLLRAMGSRCAGLLAQEQMLHELSDFPGALAAALAVCRCTLAAGSSCGIPLAPKLHGRLARPACKENARCLLVEGVPTSLMQVHCLQQRRQLLGHQCPGAGRLPGRWSQLPRTAGLVLAPCFPWPQPTAAPGATCLAAPAAVSPLQRAFTQRSAQLGVRVGRRCGWVAMTFQRSLACCPMVTRALPASALRPHAAACMPCTIDLLSLCRVHCHHKGRLQQLASLDSKRFVDAGEWGELVQAQQSRRFQRQIVETAAWRLVICQTAPAAPVQAPMALFTLLGAPCHVSGQSLKMLRSMLGEHCQQHDSECSSRRSFAPGKITLAPVLTVWAGPQAAPRTC